MPYISDAIHIYRPDDTGRCTSGWWNTLGKWVDCPMRQKDSSLHDDPQAGDREFHWHDGGDCMCFESWQTEEPLLRGAFQAAALPEGAEELPQPRKNTTSLTGGSL